MSIWTGECRLAGDLTWWGVSPPMGARWTRVAKTQSAVEKAGAWKPAKTKSRFPPAPTLPCKSRQRREIPTFPPRRVLYVSQNQKPRRLTPPKPKPDRSCVNKTGQLDVLTTAGGIRVGARLRPHAGGSPSIAPNRFELPASGV